MASNQFRMRYANCAALQQKAKEMLENLKENPLTTMSEELGVLYQEISAFIKDENKAAYKAFLEGNMSKEEFLKKATQFKIAR